VDEAPLAIHADVDLRLRGPAGTSRNTTSCLFWSGASEDTAAYSSSFASGALGLRPRRGETGSGDQSRINDRALLHCHSVGLKVSLHRLKNLLPDIVLL
jgi:hypothetical protein